MGEELWQAAKPVDREGTSLTYEAWPTWDEALCQASEQEVVFQVNGKLRSKALLPTDASKEELLAAAKADPKVQEQLAGKVLRKEIVVPGRLVNLVANEA